MKAKLNNILLIGLLVIVILGIFTPMIYWLDNPELSQMQVFLKLWWVNLLTIGAFILFYIKINK